MDPFRRQPWIPAALLVGAVYFLVGRVFALPVSHLRIWRLAAWAISGGAFAAHIGFEHFKLRNSPRGTAWHVALAITAVPAFLVAWIAAVVLARQTRNADVL